MDRAPSRQVTVLIQRVHGRASFLCSCVLPPTPVHIVACQECMRQQTERSGGLHARRLRRCAPYSSWGLPARSCSRGGRSAPKSSSAADRVRSSPSSAPLTCWLISQSPNTPAHAFHVMHRACTGKGATQIGPGPACRTRLPEMHVRPGCVKACTASADMARSDQGGCAAIKPKLETSMGFLMCAFPWTPRLHGRWTFCASARRLALRQGGLRHSGLHTSGLRCARGGQGTAGPRAAPRAVRPAALALSAAGAVGTWAPVCALLHGQTSCRHVRNRSAPLVQCKARPVPRPVLPRENGSSL